MLKVVLILVPGLKLFNDFYVMTSSALGTRLGLISRRKAYHLSLSGLIFQKALFPGGLFQEFYGEFEIQKQFLDFKNVFCTFLEYSKDPHKRTTIFRGQAGKSS